MPPSSPTRSAAADTQAGRPTTHLGLSRVGVTGVERVVRIGPGERGELFFAELECFVDLGPRQKGAHMSRFEEVVNEAVDEVVATESLRAETVAVHIAERVRERQGGLRAEVTIAARYPEAKRTPVTGLATQEIHTLLGAAVASETGTRRVVGVEAQGITACPCAQDLVATRSRARLLEEGFDEEEIDRILTAVPVATHNQRGIGTLRLGLPEGFGETVDAAELRDIVEASMSSEIYELMKRPDELEVVERAHRRPRFVEDCVREMVRMTVERYAGHGEELFVSARQRNLETIHRHDVVAERHGLLGELAAELAGDAPAQARTLRGWLESP